MAARTTLVCCLILLCLAFVANTVSGYVDWFGNRQYKCHCEGECDSEGNCESACTKGWFGPACQYVDLVYTESTSSAHQFLLDGDDNTCYSLLSDPTTVTLKEPFPFTWLRLHVKQPGALDFLQVSLKDENGADVPCEGRKIGIVDNETVDVHCDVTDRIQHVIISGEGLTDLCSIYISGGRNVALKQRAWQTTEPLRDMAKRAVDGQTETCTHTNLGDILPRFRLYLPRNFLVNRYVLNNTLGDYPDRLRGFSMTSYRYEGPNVWRYLDSSIEPMSEHKATSSYSLPVQMVELIVKETIEGTRILSLCEIEVYGDSLCPEGIYGRNCEHLCNCGESTESCLVSTGICPIVCDEGLTEESCT